jgi:signal transduction histidine kinase
MAATPPGSAAVVPLEQALDLAVQLLGEVETAAPSREYYGRLCTAVARFIRMERAGIWLYDAGRHDVSLVGTYGVDFDDLASVHASVETAPIARQAFEEDRVVVTDAPHEAVPRAFADVLGLHTLACAPLSAAGAWYGVLLADRGGPRFELSDLERDLFYLSGKVVALAASTRIAVRQQERARRLSDRLDLAREIHERVLQRLFGVSMVLSAGGSLGEEERTRAAGELDAAAGDLRRALERPLARPWRRAARTLRQELDRLPEHRPALPVTVTWPEGLEVPDGAEALAQNVLVEALRNVRKHADPTRVDVEVAGAGGAWSLEIRNDGARAPGPRGGVVGGGMGLRLASFEALQHGGVLEFGPLDGGSFRVRLVLPRGPA